MSNARQLGAIAYRERKAFESNPYLNDPDLAAKCLKHEWPENAREWHEGWSEEATKCADIASGVRPKHLNQPPV